MHKVFNILPLLRGNNRLEDDVQHRRPVHPRYVNAHARASKAQSITEVHFNVAASSQGPGLRQYSI